MNASRFVVIPDRSAILIRARSNVGAIEFGTTGVRGDLSVGIRDGTIDPSGDVKARLEVEIGALTSGNSLYDAELLNRVDARAHPLAVVELEHAKPVGTGERFEVTGHLTFHGITAEVNGVVSANITGDGMLTFDGEKAIDIRDFEIVAPTMLMLKIYPDVRVFLHLEAEADLEDEAGAVAVTG